MSDTPDLGFGKFVPGFDFLQGLARQAAGGVVQGVQQSIPQLPNLGNWVAPTFNVEELEKRIEELKAVHFWLDQNAKALGATIQALEVQKMTLATLQGMNFSLGDVANALKIKAADTVAGVAGLGARKPTAFAGLEVPPSAYHASAPAVQVPAPEPMPAKTRPKARKTPAARGRKAAPAPAPAGVVDPVQWWGSLSQQFQNIAANAMKDMAKQGALDTPRQVAAGLTKGAVQTATGVASGVARNLGDTVARNVGAAATLGKAASRAVSRTASAPSARTPPSAKTKAKTKAGTKTQAAPRKVARPRGT